MSCSTNSTVIACRPSAVITMSIIGNFSSADTPLVGSSSSSSLGWPVSAIAMSSSLRTPPGSSATLRSRCSLSLKRTSSSSARATAVGVRAACQNESFWPWQAVATSILSSTVSSAHNCGIWNERATPRRVIARGDKAVMSRSSSEMLPSSGFR